MFKKFMFFIVISAAAGFYIGQLSTNGNNSQQSANEVTQSAVYVCPMHPDIIAPHLENCPICGMDMVLKNIAGRYTVNALPQIKINPGVAHNLAIRTARVKRGELKRNIETIGKITRVDPMARRTITPPIRGELLYIAEKYQGDMVQQGELLFTLTSEKLVEMQTAYKTAFIAGDRATANAMIPELSRMGLSPEQIGKLQQNTEAMPVDVYAFEDGFVYSRRGKIGESVHTGFTIFNVGGNYQVIEVTAEIFERQWSWVEEGQQAVMTVRGLPGMSFSGQVVRVEPPVGYTTRSLEIALKFRTDNPELSQSMFAHISISGKVKKNVLLVPTNTVIKTGKGDRVVLLKSNNVFQPVGVVAGEASDGWTEIRSGLKQGDKVVASGQFLIDSESNLQAGLKRMYSDSNDAAEQHSKINGEQSLIHGGEAHHQNKKNEHDISSEKNGSMLNTQQPQQQPRAKQQLSSRSDLQDPEF